MESFFARHGLSEFGDFFEDLGVESVEDLKFVDLNDLTDEGMDQAAAENLAKRIKHIVQKENLGGGKETETEMDEEEEEEEEALRCGVERLVIKEDAGDAKRAPQHHAAAAAGGTTSISSPAAASSGDSSMPRSYTAAAASAAPSQPPLLMESKSAPNISSSNLPRPALRPQTSLAIHCDHPWVSRPESREFINTALLKQQSVRGLIESYGSMAEDCTGADVPLWRASEFLALNSPGTLLPGLAPSDMIKKYNFLLGLIQAQDTLHNRKQLALTIETFPSLLPGGWIVWSWCHAFWHCYNRRRFESCKTLLRQPLNCELAQDPRRLYIIRRTPHFGGALASMVEYTGLRLKPEIAAPAGADIGALAYYQHFKLQEGCLVSLKRVVVDRLPPTNSKYPIIYWALVRRQCAPQIEGYIRLSYLQPHCYVSGDALPTTKCGVLKVGLLKASRFFRLESGVLSSWKKKEDFELRFLPEHEYLLTSCCRVELKGTQELICHSVIVVGKHQHPQRLHLWADTEHARLQWQFEIAKHLAWIRPMLKRPSSMSRPDQHALDWTLHTSMFKEEYQAIKKPETKKDVLVGVDKLLELYCHSCGCDRAEVARYYKTMEDTILVGHIGSVEDVCQRLWTSGTKLKLVKAGQPERKIEFCSVLNRVLKCDGRVDSAATEGQRRELLRTAARLCRGINGLCVFDDDGIAREAAKFMHVKLFPKNGITYRGGGFNETHRKFFTKNKCIRFPCYLATSTSWHTAMRFMHKVPAEYSKCWWTFKMDPRGKHDPRFQCQHVNIVTKRALRVRDEQEWLFQHFAPFRIKEVQWSTRPTDDSTPHRITLEVLLDSKAHSEKLPLSPWS